MVAYKIVLVKDWLITDNKDREIDMRGVSRSSTYYRGPKGHGMIFTDLNGIRHHKLRVIGLTDDFIEKTEKIQTGSAMRFISS